MKFYSLISFVPIVFILCSCHKENPKTSVEVAGEYDWEESASPETNGTNGAPLVTYTPSLVGKNYGIKIKRNGKVFFYENGKLFDQGVVEDYGTSNYELGETITIQIKKNNSILEFTYRNQVLWNENWPYPGYSNALLDLEL